MKKIIDFIRASKNEMTEHVHWPSLKELQESSVLVLIGTAIFAVVIGLIDLGFRNLLDSFYTYFKF